MTNSIIDGDAEEAVKLAQQAVEQGISPMDAINKGFVIGVQQVGSDFSCGAAFLPELVMAGEAMKAAMGVLEVELAKSGATRDVLGKVVIGTIEGDIHDIGKTLVGVMLSINGFEVHDLGPDVPVTKFVEKAREVNADLVAVSALLTTTMTKQRFVVEALEDMGMRDSVKVMVGGAPVTRTWAAEIGADGYSEDAVGAVAVAKDLLGLKV
jgi:corrinoid protein of di/trimethylamine methyltransferase